MITRLAAPIALAQLGLTAITLVDVAVLGHASTVELGGASVGRAIGFASAAVGMGVGSTLEPLAAQALGAGERDEAWRALVAAVVSCVLVWVPSAALAYASTFLLEPIGIDKALAAAARSFLVPQLPGMLGYTVFLAMKSFLQAHERTLPSLVAAVIANVVNIVVCNVLVRGDEALVAVGLPPRGLVGHGCFGAGLASSISMFVLVGWVLFSAVRLRPSPRSAARPLPVAKVLRLGAPLGFQLLAEMGVFSFVALLAGRLGSIAVSAHQIAIGLASFTFMGALGIGGATAVRVGHAIGERRSPRDAGLLGIAIGAAFMSVSAVFFFVLRRPLVALFTTDPAIIELGAQLLVIAAAFQLFDGIQAVAAGALRGAADVRFSFFANVAAHWLLGLPLALWLGFSLELGAKGLWFGLLAGLIVVSALLVWRFVSLTGRAIARA